MIKKYKLFQFTKGKDCISSKITTELAKAEILYLYLFLLFIIPSKNVEKVVHITG